MSSRILRTALLVCLLVPLVASHRPALIASNDSALSSTDVQSFGMSDEKELSLNVQWQNHNENVKIKFRFCGQGNTRDEAIDNLKNLARTQFDVVRDYLMRQATGKAPRVTQLNSSECRYPAGVFFNSGEFANLVAACSAQVSSCGSNSIKCFNSLGKPCWRPDTGPKTKVR